MTAAVNGNTARGRRVREALGQALAGVLAAAIALTDPGAIIIGGPWGTVPAVLDAIQAQAGRLSRRPTLRAAAVIDAAPLAGARAEAIALLRHSITHYRTTWHA